MSSGQTLALKIQTLDSMFYSEVRIMRKISKQKIIGFPKIDSFGKLDDNHGYIAMQLLGENSLEIMKRA